MPTTMAEINKAIDAPHRTKAEQYVIQWQFGLLGDFRKALFDCIKLADVYNLARLNEVFPVEVDGFIQWTLGDLVQRLRAEGLDI